MNQQAYKPTNDMNPRFPRVSLCIAGNATRYFARSVFGARKL